MIKSMGPAVMLAGPRRLRAILFTSLITLVGLTPIVVEASVQAQFLIPMAIGLSGGVAFATPCVRRAQFQSGPLKQILRGPLAYVPRVLRRLPQPALTALVA
ncbi:MAG: efflux RND transporter permease subunit [bacterium]|nr:efflux RND transporter permease subunit [bacterium]